MSEIVISGCIKEISSLLDENYFTVMSIIAALYIGLLAFMYPKIIEVKQNVNNNFLYKYFARNFGIKNYCFIISFLLISNLLSIGCSLCFNICLYIYFNLFLAIMSIVLNIYIINKIEEICFNVDKILDKEIIKKIDYSKDLSERTNLNDFCDNINIIQDLILELVDKSSIKYELLDKYFDYFINVSHEYIKKIYKKQWSSNDNNNYYYKYPLERLLYINKRIADDNKIDIKYAVQNKLLKLCEKIDIIIKSDSFNPIPEFIYSCLFQSITYVIEIHKLDYELITYIIHNYFKLIKKSKNGQSLYLSMRPNYYLFNNIKKIINNGYDFNYIKQIRQGLENILSPLFKESYFNNDSELYEDAQYYIININFDILGYFYYKNDYQSIRDYISNKFSNIFCMFLNNMNSVIRYVFQKNTSVFANIFELKFNEYTKDIEYKYYILFLYMCLIKQQINIHLGNIDWLKKSTRKDKNDFIKIEQDSIDNFLNKKYENTNDLIKISNNSKYETYINNFFNNTELLNLFKIETEDIKDYKEFVISQIKEIENISNK